MKSKKLQFKKITIKIFLMSYLVSGGMKQKFEALHSFNPIRIKFILNLLENQLNP